MTDRLQLAWTDGAGHAETTRLRVLGWTADELRALRGLDAVALGEQVVVLPEVLVEAAARMRDLQPLAGRVALDGDAVTFTPRFPFIAGTHYAVLVGPRREHAGSIALPPLIGEPSAEVLAIYPTAAEVPVNVLKLYVQFSRPMSEGWQRRAVHVRRADTGEALDGVFFPLEPELWDTTRQRLTLLLDPGRIKRGLLPHEQAGYPLVEGVSIVVIVDQTFRDAEGARLRVSAERRYGIGSALYRRVEPAGWRYSYPAAETRDPLVVGFDRPLDRALLERALTVLDGEGMAVAGAASVGHEERTWRFEPVARWAAGRHVLRVDGALEDVAGNSVIRVFDRDLTRVEDTPLTADSVEVEFVPLAHVTQTPGQSEIHPDG